MSSFPTVARRAFALVAVVACAVVSLPSSAAVTLLGSIASQPHVPARLTTCDVSVDGGGFVPTIAFAQQPDPVARYTVTLAFFDRKNVSVGRVDVTDHGADVYDLPAHADSMSCAITHLTLDSGSVYPAAGGGASLGGVALGVLGAGAILGIALGVSHHSSTTTTAAPTASPSPSPTSSTNATASPTASSSVSTTPSPVPTATITYAPTPSPFPTGTTTPVPTARPNDRRPR